MDFYRSSKSKSQKKRLSRNEAPLLKPDMMLITKDVMLPVKLPPPPGKLFSMQRIGMKNNLKITGLKRIGNQSSKPLLDPEIVEKNFIESSLIDTHSKNSSSRMINDIPPSMKTKQVPFRKLSSYCLPQSKLLKKKSCPEKTDRVPLGREEQSSRPDLRISVHEERDRSNFDPDPKTREADEPLIPSSENSLSSITASLETGSCSSSRVSGAFGDSLPKLPELNIISSSESEFSVSNPEQFKRMIISHDINECNEINIVEKIETKPKRELVTSTSETVNKNSKESIETKVDPGLEIYGSKDKCQNWIETRNLIATDKSDRLDDRETNKLIVHGEMDNNFLLSDEKDQSYTEAAENDLKTDDQILVDVKCLVQLLIANVSVLEDSNNLDTELENAYPQTNLQNPYPLDEERSGNDSDERQPAIVGLRYSLDDLPSSVLPIDKCSQSCIKDEPIIDFEKKYSWQRIDPVTPNVISNSDFHLIETNDEIEAKYSWQMIEEKCKEFNDISNSDEDAFAESKSGEFKQNVDRKKVSTCNNSKLTCTEDICMNEPEYQYSWQKLTSKYLTGNQKEDRFVNRSQPARNIDLNIPMNADKESMKNRLPIKETFMSSSNSISSYTVDKKYKGSGKDIGKILVNSPLNNIISSMLPDIRVINRHPGFDKTRNDYLSSNLNSESSKSSTRYSSMSSIKQIIASLNEMVKTQKSTLDSYVRDHISEENADMKKSAPVPDRAEKVEIFPSTLHVLGDYIVRDIHPEDINNPNNFSNKKITACTNVAPQNPLPDTNLTRSKNRSSQLPLDFPSMKSCPISFETFNFVPEASDSEKDYKAEIFRSKDGSLLPVLEQNSILTDNDWDPGIAAMDKPVVSTPDSSRDNEGKIDEAGSLPYTKSVGLLKPRLQISFSEAKEAGDSNTRKDELVTRLESAMSRLKQCEQQVDANWNLDYSVLDEEEKISQEKVETQLPKQVEEHIKDIIQSAEEYLAKLEEQLKDLRTADDQIINSSERTFKDIDETYQLLMDNLCQEINKRRNLVRLETEVFKYEGLAPLRACKQEVDAQIRSTQHLIVLTETMLTHPSTFNRDRLGKIITATSHMGRIPAVPMPEELPYVTFSPPNEDVKKEIADRISCLGCVLRMGPAQFTEVCERPAGLQLKWHIVDPEFASEEQTFVVQKALGEISEPTSPAFETVYVGSETSCFVRDLPVDHPITLRVGIQVSDTAWSVHRIAQTSIPAYSWDPSNSDYLITNSGRIATKVTQNISTLLSRGAQFSVDHIIEFKFLETSSGGSEEGIGLVYDPSDATESLKRIGALLITPNGNIFIDGEEKLMQLPKMQLGTRIIFTSEQKDEETLRMTIECANKAVTYDWTVQKPLHFAARFIEHNKWNFMVK